MAGTARRAGGVVLIMLGVLFTVVGMTAAPVAADEHNVAPICNNQQGDDQDCKDDQLHGEVTWSIVDGDLVFDLTATDGSTEWRQIYICIPGTARSNGADCQGNTGSVLSPDGYEVTGAEGVKENDKDVEFDCDAQFGAVVPSETLDALDIDPDDFAWTIHVNTCSGGTDEAFGEVSVTPPPPPVRSYTCAAPDLDGNDATLKGSTDDPDVTGASFALTKSGGSAQPVAATEGAAGVFTGAANDLDNGDYTYTITFTGTELTETSDVCAFTVNVQSSSQTPIVDDTPTEQAVVAGVQVSREEAPAVIAATAPAPAVQGVTLAATGLSPALLALGLALVGMGAILVIGAQRTVRPAGLHYID
jgi:hypothetical protein